MVGCVEGKRLWNPRWIAICGVALALVTASCGKGVGPELAPGENRPQPVPEAGEVAPDVGLWVTFEQVGETFRAVVTREDSIQYVLDYIAGRVRQRIPSGDVLPGGKHNSPWSWHLAPDSITFSEITIELCDARPSYLEEHRQVWIEEVRRYCPWGARIVAAQDCRSGTCGPELMRPI